MDPKKVKELEKVSVKSFAELQQALKPFLPDAKTGDSAIYKVLVEGLEMVKRQSEFSQRASQMSLDDFGGYIPAMPQSGSYSWVDTLISRRLDAKREDLLITWSLPEGKYTFDAFTRKLEKIDG